MPRKPIGLRHCNEPSVSHVHHFADRLERLVGNPVGAGVSFVEHVAHDGRVAGQLATTLPQRPEVLVDGLGDERLEGDGATVAQFVGDVDRAAAGADRCGEQEARNLRALLGVIGDGAQAVRLGFAQQRSRAVLVVAERDGVGAALAHLRAVGAEQNRSGAE